MTFRARIIKPRATEWLNFGVDTPEDAAQALHDRNGRSCSAVYVPDADMPASEVWFALVEVEGHGEFVSRIYRNGIGRRGGVRRKAPATLADIAREVGWTKDPAELVALGWYGEQEEWT